MSSDSQFYWSLGVTIAGLLVTGVCMYYQRKSYELMLATISQKKRAEYEKNHKWWWWPLVLMVCLSASAWIPYFLTPPKQIPYEAILGWGTVGPPGVPFPTPGIGPGLYVAVDGNVLLDYRKKYRVAAIAFHNTGSIDPGDVKELQKSALYDIRPEHIEMRIPLDSKFVSDVESGMRMTNYDALLVPNEVRMSDFSTTHEAGRLGVIRIGGRAGPP